MSALDPRLLRPSHALSARDVHVTLEALLDPNASTADRVGILAQLTARPERSADLAGFARAMRARARPFRVLPRLGAVDLCGTGGAARGSFNISTASAFVVAAAGVPVVKHGNRSARGPCGSSDLLEALGLPVTSSAEFARASFRRYRLAFLHAPLYHPATAAVAEARRLLGVRTIFNRLGPLTNPARVPYQVVGVPDLPTARRTAGALARLGTRRSLTVTAAEGCDEFSPQGRTRGYVQTGRRVRSWAVEARRHLPPEDRHGDWGALPPADAAAEVERILAGGGGARRGAVLLTSGAALWISGRARNLAAGVDRATASLDSGGAERKLGELRQLAVRFRGRRER